MRLTQKIMTFLLLLAVLMQLSGSLIVVLAFENNRKHIKENFCINIAKPTLECAGQCFLIQKLSEQHRPDNEQAKHFWQLCLEQLLGAVPTSLLDSNFKLFYLPNNNTLNRHNTHKYFRLYISLVFRPPIKCLIT